ncbi:hypothetical protein HBH74_132080 [Parastagonospora nodorum]|nr:hypothetical protein HBH93_125450 [Parastagonospora nodorum]KAH4855623.1 hypothetical protein HBH75_085290 [Parastagonospora nodorum]KAH4919187.1 hypothetical protein HBH74_132080 [Parastagonospora nodorum]
MDMRIEVDYIPNGNLRLHEIVYFDSQSQHLNSHKFQKWHHPTLTPAKSQLVLSTLIWTGSEITGDSNRQRNASHA